MSVLSAEEQELFDVAKSTLPRWFFQDGDPEETIAAFAKIMQLGRAQVQTWLDATYILKATGFWLDQHAKDRALARQNGESDDNLRTRIRSYADAVTTPAIKSAVNTILTQAGVTDSCEVIESRRDQAYYHSGTARQFYGRGRRYGRSNHRAIRVVVPQTTPDGALASILAALRVLAAGGVDVSVDRYDPAQLFVVVSIRPVASVFSLAGGGSIIFDYSAAGVHNNALANWPVLNPIYGTVSATGVWTPPASVPAIPDVLITPELASTPGRNFCTARIKIVA